MCDRCAGNSRMYRKRDSTVSVSVQTDIFCDIEGNNCIFWAYGGPSSYKARIREARAYVKRDGWVYKYNDETISWQDICPNCHKDLDK